MRFLVLPATGIGDMIMTLPVISTIKANNPDSHIDVIYMENGVSEVIKYYSYINNGISYGIKAYTILNLIFFILFRLIPLLYKLRKNRYDWIISPIPNFLRYIICYLGGSKNFIYGKDKSANPSENLSELLAPLNFNRFDYDYSLNIGESDLAFKKYGIKKKSYIVINLHMKFGKNDLRNWPYFDQLISILSQKHTIVIIGQNKKNKIKNDHNIIDLVNKTNLSDILHILKNAKLVICPDGSIMHMSYALNTKVIGMFGPVDYRKRAPINNFYLKAVYTNQLCSPCASHNVSISCKNKINPHICMQSISTDMILKYTKELLD